MTLTLDQITDGRVATTRTTHDLDAHQRFRAAVVGRVQYGLQLDHDARSTTGYEPPGLVTRERSALGDRYRIALTRLVGLIVSEQLRRAANVLAVTRVLDQARNFDRDGLVHFVADDPPGERAQRLGSVAVVICYFSDVFAGQPPSRRAPSSDARCLYARDRSRAA